ncbi:MAG TPA: 3-ketoacyl-ACP reductase [Casimicrobiaceae bacterium]|nr:3-ketoacyl-ACP reductase [Casimicrobiaceae bacterium]
MAQRPTALVTGGNRGIGRGIVVALAQRGFDVAFVDVSETEDTEHTTSLAREAGAKVAFIRGDIAELAGHDDILHSAWDLTGHVDALVNNAGVSVPVRGDLLEVTPDQLDPVMNVNFRGTFFLTQAFARRLLASPRPEWHRAIVTVTSVNAEIIAPDRAAYCCSKTALSMMVKLFAARLAPHGIGCYELRPGIIRTDMTRVAAARYDRIIAEGAVPMPRWGEPEDVGRAAALLCAGELTYMTGEALHVDGGLHLKRL